MERMKKWILFLVVMGFVVLSGTAQDRGPIANPAPGVLDGVYVQEHIPTKKVVPYEYIREADVTWSKRVWRVIDLREKFNHPIYYPLDDLQPGASANDFALWNRNPTRWSLWTIIRYHVLTGDLTAYSPYDPDWQQWQDGDLFKYPISASKYALNGNPNATPLTDSLFMKQLKQYLGITDMSGGRAAILSIEFPGEDSIDANGNTAYYEREYDWYRSQDIVQYRIKEDWFFDKERSVLDVRIIGIAPVTYRIDDQTGEISGLKELFWLYFPECRYVFQNFFVQNRNNDAQRMSFDDLFWKRMFQSYIMKETNLYDREIESYKAGVDALLEAEKIKDQIFTFEHDLWNF